MEENRPFFSLLLETGPFCNADWIETHCVARANPKHTIFMSQCPKHWYHAYSSMLGQRCN